MNGGNGKAVRVVLSHVCALAVAGYFLYAAYGKIRYPGQFALAIRNYQMVPEMLLNLMALFMPWWEVGGAVALLIPRTRRAGAIIVSALLVVFIIAISYAALYKGLDIDCGCIGKNSSKAGWSNIILDVGLLIATVGAVYLPLGGRDCVVEPCRATFATERASS